MVFNSTYISTTWHVLSQKYEENVKNWNGKYINILNKHGKVLLKQDGSIMIDINNMSPFFLYSGEFFRFIQALTAYVPSICKELTDDGTLKRTFKKINDEFDVTGVGLNASCYNKRADEYSRLPADSILVGASLPSSINIHSCKERFAAMFADCVAAYNSLDDFQSYEEVFKQCSISGDEGLAKDIYYFAIDLYEEIEKQDKPYLSGDIMNTRKAKGVCPNCGGTFKGLFSKKCSNCGTPKEK